MDKEGIKLKASMLKKAQDTTSDERLLIITRLIEALPNAIEPIINAINLSSIKDYDIQTGQHIPGRKVEQLLYHMFVENDKIRAIRVLMMHIRDDHGFNLSLKDAKKAIEAIKIKYLDRRDELVGQLSNQSIQAEIDALPTPTTKIGTTVNIPDVHADLPPHIESMVKYFNDGNTKKGERLDADGYKLIWDGSEWITDVDAPPSTDTVTIGKLSGVPIRTTKIRTY